MSDIESLKTAIMEYVEQHDYVSFYELQVRMGDRFTMTGDLEMAFERSNIVLWSGVSQMMSNAVRELEMERKIEFDSCDPRVYLIDGMVLNYPLMKRAPSNGRFETPHWAPVVIRPYASSKIHRDRAPALA